MNDPTESVILGMDAIEKLKLDDLLDPKGVTMFGGTKVPTCGETLVANVPGQRTCPKRAALKRQGSGITQH